MEYSNAQILAAVVSEWARPAISQIATGKLTNLSAVRSLQNSIVNSGIVGQGYNISTDIMPFMNNAVNSLIQPMLEQYFAKLPDQSIPQLAHSIVDTAMQQPKFAILDGFIEFDQSDMMELKDMLDKNLPLSETTNGYQIVR